MRHFSIGPGVVQGFKLTPQEQFEQDEFTPSAYKWKYLPKYMKVSVTTRSNSVIMLDSTYSPYSFSFEVNEEMALGSRNRHGLILTNERMKKNLQFIQGVY